MKKLLGLLFIATTACVSEKDIETDQELEKLVQHEIDTKGKTACYIIRNDDGSVDEESLNCIKNGVNQ